MAEPTGIARPSGIRPPAASRIGRPTGATVPTSIGLKPPSVAGSTASSTVTTPVVTTALPSPNMPTGRLGEDFCRMPLADVDEECETTDTSLQDGVSQRPSSKANDRRTSTCSSGGSDGGLLEYSRTSRRGSDQSVVLTSDTDSFVIGQRIWVNGIRPGQIVYIGETQFAPGVWAGVVLDEPNGKNDGCVSGVRYFQCPPLRGVFSRLWRLTHEPLVGAVSSPTTPTNRMGSGDYAGSLRISPASSMNSLAMKSPGKMPTIGERVIVSSATAIGSRAGILKFIGETSFAKGIWCGVQLDEPSGKNDGSVDGVRYFDCPQHFGLFAPVGKVSLSPSARRPSNMSRIPSKESILSASMSMTSAMSKRTASARMSSMAGPRPLPTPKSSLQDLLKEKQNHIEQLLKERDIERGDVDVALLQARQAKAEIDKLREALSRLQSEKNALNAQIEEEKRKTEDLQFSVDEQTIFKEDLSHEKEEQIIQNTANIERIQSLEQQLQEQLSLVEALKSKEVALHDSLKNANELTKGLGDNNELIASLKAQLDGAHLALKTHTNDMNASQKQHEQNLAALKEELESTRTSCSNALEESNMKHLAEIESFNTKLAESQRKLLETIQDKHQEIELEKLQQKLNETISKNNTDILQLKESLSQEKSGLQMELSAKQTELEITSSNLQVQTERTQLLETQLQQVRTELECNKNEIDLKFSNQKLLENSLSQKIITLDELVIDLQNEIKQKNNELELKSEAEEKMKDTANEELRYLSTQMDSMKSELEERNEAIEKQYLNMKATEDALKEEIQLLQNQMKIEIKETMDIEGKKTNELKELLEKEESANKENNEKIISLSQELKEIKDQNTILLAQLVDKDKTITEQNNDKMLSIDSLNTELNQIIEQNANLSSELTGIKISESKLGVLTEDLKKHISEQDSQIAELSLKVTTLLDDLAESNKQKDIMAAQNENSLQKVSELTQKTAKDEETITNLQSNISKMELDIGDLSRKLSASVEKFNDVNEQKVKLEADLTNLRSNSVDSNSELKRISDELKSKEVEVAALKENISLNKMAWQSREQELNIDLESKTQQWLKQKTAFEESINDRDEKHAQINEEIKIMKEQLNNTKMESAAKIDELNLSLLNEKNAYKTLLESNQSTESILKEQIIALSQEKENIKQEFQKHLDESANLSNKNETELKEIKNINEKTIKNLQEQLEESKTVMQKMENDYNLKINTIETSSGEVLKQIDELKMNETNLNKILADTNSSNSDLIKQMEIMKQTETDLRSNLLQCESSIVELQNIQKSTKEEALQLSSQLHIMEVSESQLQILLKELKHSEDELKMQLEEVKKLSSSGNDELLKKLNEKDLLLDDIKKSHEKEKNKMASESAEQLMKMNDMNILIDNLQMEMLNRQETAKKTIDDQVQNLLQATEQNTILETELANMKQKSCELESDLKHGKEGLEKIVNDKVNLEKTILDRNSQISDLEEKLKQYNLNQSASEQSASEHSKNLNILNDEIKHKNELLQKQVDQENILNCEISDLKLRIEILNNTEKELEIQRSYSTGIQKSLDEKINENKKLVEVISSSKDYEVIIDDLKLKNKNLNDEILIVMKEKESLATSIVKSEKLETSDMTAVNNNDTFLDSQVQFLNGIIVDMQRKNEELQNKVEALEGINTQSSYNSIVKRLPAPRAYCDICEVFDAHETEDCPTQGDSDLPPVHYENKPRVLPPERPYCDICEMFGHETENCEADETY